MSEGGRSPVDPQAARIAELETRVARLEKVNSVLIDRVERSMDSQGSAFSLFQTAIGLERQIREAAKLIAAAREAGDIPPELYRPRLADKGVYGDHYIGHPTVDMSPIQGPGTFILWQNVPYEWALHMDDDAEHASRAKKELRRLIDVEARFLKKWVPGFEQAFISHVGRYVGVRGDLRVVGDQHHGVAVVAQPLEQGEDFLAGLRIQRAGGFVGEQDRRMVDQRARDGHALLLPARKLAGQVVDAVFQPHGFQRCAGYLALFFGRAPPSALVHHRQHHVVQRRKARQQVVGLEDKAQFAAADAGHFSAVVFAHILAGQDVLTVAGAVHAGQDIEQRAFARAARPHDGHEFARQDA